MGCRLRVAGCRSSWTSRRIHLSTLLALAMVLSLLVSIASPELGEARNGRRKPVGAEVVGGHAVPDGKYPFLVALGYEDRSGSFLWRNQFCGGSLIAPSYVLTAAHCVAGGGPSQLTIVVGRTDLTSSVGEVHAVAAIMVHPGYNPQTIGHDVAVVKLAEPVESVAPIALAEVGDGSLQEPGDVVTLTGWGDTLRYPHLGRPGVFRSRLQERTVAIVGDGACNRQWRRAGYRRGIAQELVICTSARKAGHGDSGSPVFAAVDGNYVQVGLVSGGYGGSGKRKVADFHTQVNAPAIADFIEESIAT